MIVKNNTNKKYWIIKCTKCGKPGHWSHQCKK
uniref:CCHC-type domain-containing protein n=1 Tax=viral metagenome TaxID=1070528 RepID=A0A6C0H9U1_9ZZZZ